MLPSEQGVSTVHFRGWLNARSDELFLTRISEAKTSPVKIDKIEQITIAFKATYPY